MESVKYTGLEVAIIGMSGKFPGAACPDDLWENLCEGVESIARFSDEELLQNGVSRELFDDPSYIRAKGVIDNPELFEEEFFNYTQREAALMDPQIRLLHEGVWHALENAGYDPQVYKKRIGIFAGATANPFWHAAALSTEFAGLAQIVADKDYICTRIANALNLRGPAVFVQTACSTSLVAVHVACRSLLTGDCEMAVAGGIGLSVPHKVGYLYQEGMINCSDGHCRAFDERADGMVGGEGYGVVVLKPLKKAIADGDYIHAIIKGSAINNDGASKISFAAPSMEGQTHAVRMAHSISRVPAASIGFIEAHGTGTYIGDPVEVKALTKAFGDQDQTQFCHLGSIKTNIGHLDHAAGVAGLIKAVLCLKNKQIPPTLHYQTPNPELHLDTSPFVVNNKLHHWPRPQAHPRRAAVNSLGIGGTNAYAILEEAPEPVNSAEHKSWYLLPMSARTSESLGANQRALGEFILKHGDQQNLVDVAYTLSTGRKAFPFRSAIVCKDQEQAAELLSGEQSPTQFSLGINEVVTPPKNTVFMFPGQGTQYHGMFSDLSQESPVFKKVLDECFAILTLKGYSGLDRHLFEGAENSLLESHTAIAQPVLFSVEYALAQMLKHNGIEPTACVGHSLGEYVAACQAGVMTLDDALYVVAERGRLMQSVEAGEMLSTAMSVEEVRELIDDSLSIAAVNGEKSTVVAGSKDAIKAIKVKLDELKVRHLVINPDHAFHSYMVESILDDFAQVMSKVTLSPPRIPVASNLTGTWLSDKESVSVEYWVQHMRSTVQFATDIDTLATLEDAVFIEVGPGNVLARLVKQKSGSKPLGIVSIGKNKRDAESEYYHLQRSMGQLWMTGLSIDWDHVYGDSARRIPLPGYVFNARRYNFDLLKNMKAPYLSDEMVGDSGGAVTGTTSLHKDQDVQSLDSEQDGAKEVVTQAFASTLGVESVNSDDDFFALGGDSYTAMIVIAKIHKSLNVLIPLTVFFSHATVDAITQYVGNAEKNEHTEIKAVEVRDSYPLSPAQLRLYIVQQTEVNNIGYNESLETLVIGEIDKKRLETAFQKLIERHESLRTSFIVNHEEIVQVIQPEVDFKVSYFQTDDAHVDELLNNFVKPFDLEKAPLLRASLISINEQKHILVVDFHHIIIDGVAMGVVFDELLQFYQGETPEQLSIQYKDFAVWQNSSDYRKYVEKQEAYWVDRFKNNLPTDLNLPADFPRPHFRTFNGASVFSAVDCVSAEQVKIILEKENVSLFMFLFSILNVFLSRVSGVDDLAVGTVVAGRRHAALEKIIGVFVNMLVIRSSPKSSMSFKEYLQQVKKLSLEAFENQECQYEELIQHLNLKRDPSRNSLFDVAFVLQNTAEAKDEVKAGDISFMPYIRDKGVAKFDLTLTVVETQYRGYHLKWDYSKNLFSQSTIEVFAQAYLNIISEVLGDMTMQLSKIKLFDVVEEDSKVAESMGLEDNLEDWVI